MRPCIAPEPLGKARMLLRIAAKHAPNTSLILKGLQDARRASPENPGLAAGPAACRTDARSDPRAFRAFPRRSRPLPAPPGFRNEALAPHGRVRRPLADSGETGGRDGRAPRRNLPPRGALFRPEGGRGGYRPMSRSRDFRIDPAALSSSDSRETCFPPSPPRSGPRSLPPDPVPLRPRPALRSRDFPSRSLPVSPEVG